MRGRRRGGGCFLTSGARSGRVAGFRSSVGAVSPCPKHREGRQASPPGGLSPPSGDGSQRRAWPAAGRRQPCRSWTLAPAVLASRESTAQGSASPTGQRVLGSDSGQSLEFEGARGGLEEPRHPWQDHRGRWGPEGPPSGQGGDPHRVEASLTHVSGPSGFLDSKRHVSKTLYTFPCT